MYMLITQNKAFYH